MVDLGALTNRELLDLWTGSLDELRARCVVRTYNNPIGDIAEAIVARHYGGIRGAFSQSAWDVAVGGELLQVKACRRATAKTKLGFSPIRHPTGTPLSFSSSSPPACASSRPGASRERRSMP
jgi:hypothetical protein